MSPVTGLNGGATTLHGRTFFAIIFKMVKERKRERENERETEQFFRFPAVKESERDRNEQKTILHEGEHWGKKYNGRIESFEVWFEPVICGIWNDRVNSRSLFIKRGRKKEDERRNDSGICGEGGDTSCPFINFFARREASLSLAGHRYSVLSATGDRWLR